MPFGIGAGEIIIILVIVLLIFGPKRLPDLGRSLGKGMREFKDSVTGKDSDHEELPAPDADAAGKEPAASGVSEAAAEPATAARERES